MYKKTRPTKSNMVINKSYEAERIEQKIQRITSNKEPIKDGAPLVYTERKEGVRPDTDIRTDRWEVATEAMDKVSKTHLARRDERHNQAKVVEMKNNDGRAEPSQGTAAPGAATT